MPFAFHRQIVLTEAIVLQSTVASVCELDERFDMSEAREKTIWPVNKPRENYMLKKSLKLGVAAGVALATAATAAAAAQCSNDTWKKVMSAGKLVVGVKADYKPWGFRDPSGKLIGMEADMAQDVADAMGVELEMVPVQSSNRMQFLEQGKIDLMIATMSDREDRRKIVGIVGPNYYTSGTNVMSPKAVGVKKWEDLKDKPVCGKQGAFYNKIVTERYGANVVAFTGNAEAKQALRDKKCIAWVYDDSSIMSDLSSGEYNDFEMPLNFRRRQPMGPGCAVWLKRTAYSATSCPACSTTGCRPAG